MQILFVGYEASESRLTEARAAGYAVDTRPGPLDAPAQAELWQSLALAAPDIVWLRWAALEPPDILAVRRFRVARPHTRIVIELPESLQPPDAGVAECVGMGVYDLVRPTHAVAATLQTQPTYADVVQWAGAGGADPDPPVVTREVVLVSPERPVILALVGVGAGVGTSCAAMSLGARLTALGQRAVLAEPAAVMSDTFHLWQPTPGADVAPTDQPWSVVAAQRRWAYVVVDCHTLWRAVPPEADRVLVVGPGSLHRTALWERWLEAEAAGQRPVWPKRTIYVVSPGPHAHQVERLVRRQVPAPTPVLIAPDLWQDPAGAAWDAALHPLVPGARSARRWWRRL